MARHFDFLSAGTSKMEEVQADPAVYPATMAYTLQLLEEAGNGDEKRWWSSVSGSRFASCKMHGKFEN